MVGIVRRRALRAGVKPPLDLVKSNGRASRAADSSVSRWMSIEDCNTQSFPSVCSFYLAALALGFAWLRCIVFLLCKFGPLQIRAISPLAQSEACVGSGRAFWADSDGGKPRDNRGSISSNLHTKSALDAQQHQSAAPAPRRRAPSKRPNRRS